MNYRVKGPGLIILCVLLLLCVLLPQYVPSEGEDGTGTLAGTADDAGDAGEGLVVESPALTPEQSRTDMEIVTSTLPELAAWCRSLGLSEGGAKADLVQRLREYYSLPSGPEKEDTRKIITIEAARVTEYFKLEVVDEDYARLTGDVQVSLKDGDATHRIRAWEMLFNRTRNTLTASGGVEYVKEQEGETETFKGQSITVNLDNWSSVFLDGASVRSVQNNETAYRFEGSVITRSNEEVTVLSKAAISNANNEEALWSLSASRVWLLPGSDFAIFNALLKVGEIPVLYIPFFYFPADEMILHPVMGYRTREGSFAQTTTYILGRPKADPATQSSLSRILGNSGDNELERQGLFLRNTGKKVKDPESATLKAIVDYYANLGAYLGAELSTIKFGVLNPINLSFGVGFTRTLAKTNSGYTPFFPDYTGASDWNKANLFSNEVPFRYRMNMSSSINGKYGSLSWVFPYYSDVWVDRDFTKRSETMDWVNMAQQGAAVEDETTSETKLGDYQWQLNGSFTPQIQGLSPFISTLSLSSFTSTLAFKTIDNTSNYSSSTDINYYSPSQTFFVPDRLTIYSASGMIAGTPLTIGAGQPAPAAGQPPEDPLKDIGVPRAPWQDTAPRTPQPQNTPDRLSPPPLSQRFETAPRGGLRFSIDYRFAPTSSSEMQFRSSEWKEYTDVKWDDIASVQTNVTGSASTTFNLDHSGGLFSNAFTFYGDGAWRQYNYINEEADQYTTKTTVVTPGGPVTVATPDPQKISDARKQMYSQSFFSTLYGYVGTLRPLYQSGVWGQSNIQYSLKGLIVKTAFDTLSTGDDPKWNLEYSEWIKEKLETHQLAANLAASIMDKKQDLTITAELPPRDTALSGNATFRVWISETNGRIRITSPEDGEKRKFEPFYATETLTFGSIGRMEHSIVLDTEKKELTSLSSALTLWGLKAEYTASRMAGYDFSQSNGWELRQVSADEYVLEPKDFSLSFTKNFDKKNIWDDRLNFSVNVNTRLFFDLQRFTNSNFSFTLGLTLGISNFLDLSLSATSENAVIFRYINNLPVFADLHPVLLDRPGDQDQYDPFLDLLDSFRFDDDARRRRSGYKMKNFKLTATHHLGDWNAVLDISLLPYLDMDALPQPAYKLNTELAFLVQWVPVSEIKSDIKYNGKNKENKWIVE